MVIHRERFGLGLGDFTNPQSCVEEQVARVLFGGAEQVGHNRNLHLWRSDTAASSAVRRNRHREDKANCSARPNLGAPGVILPEHGAEVWRQTGPS